MKARNLQKIVILGATGSVGSQCIDVVKRYPGRFKVVALTANRNIKLLEKHTKELKPRSVVITDHKSYKDFKKRNVKIKTEFGDEGIEKIVSSPEVDLVFVALSGISGLLPTITAIKNNKIVALANKETLVCAGDYIMKILKKSKAKLLPVDSEHNAIFNLLRGNRAENIKRVILTGTGGPFLNLSLKRIRNIKPVEALKHPVWKMGKRITVDSATLLNKGFEVIEAHYLFELDYDRIGVIIHPEGYIHSIIELIDGEYYMLFGPHDMRFPIMNVLFYPEIKENQFKKLDIFKVKKLTFRGPDLKKFPLLKTAYYAGRTGGTLPAVLNGLDEELVNLYLKRKIDLFQIFKIIDEAIRCCKVLKKPDIKDIFRADRWARDFVKEKVTIKDNYF